MQRSLDPLVAPRGRTLRRVRISYVVTFLIVLSAITAGELIRYLAIARADAQLSVIQAGNQVMDIDERVTSAVEAFVLAPDATHLAAARSALSRLADAKLALDQAGATAALKSSWAQFAAAAQRSTVVVESPASDAERLALTASLDVARRGVRDMLRPLLSRQESQRADILRRAAVADSIIDGLIALVLLAIALSLFEPLLRGLARQQASLHEVLRDRSQLAMIAERTDNAVLITDLKGRVEWVNRAFTRSSGYTLEEMRGKTPTSILHRGTVNDETLSRMRAARAAGQRFDGQLMNYSKSGEPYWVKVDWQPMHDDSGKVTGYMAIESDITEMRLREASLQRANLRFSVSTHAAGVGVWELDWESKQMWWSDTLLQILGAPPTSVASNWYKWIAHIHPEDREAVQCAVQNAALSGALLQIRHRIVRSGGKARQLEITARVTTSADTRSPLLVGVAVDVTERIEREITEKKLQAQLRDASRMAGMAEVATGVLHNVGNILNSVGVSVSTAQSRTRGLRVDQVDATVGMLMNRRSDLEHFLAHETVGRNIAEYVPLLMHSLRTDQMAVLDELQRLDGFVGHLRRIVQMQQSYGRFGALIEPLDIREVLDAACALLAPMQEQSGAPVQIVRRYAAVPMVETSRTKLLDIFCNLLKNAHEAVQAFPAEKQVVELSISDAEGGVSVSVTDHGCGIAAETLSRLCEFGFTTKDSGHGFGLHSVALSAQELGGRFQAQSAGIGQGATFSIWIPLRHCEPESSRVAA